MEISTYLILYILLIHFLADFALQTHEQAQNKSHSNIHLHQHVATYSAVWFLAVWSWTKSIEMALVFTVVTFFVHYCTDWVTSRISKFYFKQEDYHNGFVVVGVDQVLHYIQLIFTFKLIELL